jgi:acyl carrier protein
MINSDPWHNLTSLLTELFEISSEKMVPEADIVEDLGIDSIDLIDFLNEVNDRYDMDLELLDFEGCKTLSQLVDHIKQNEKLVVN